MKNSIVLFIFCTVLFSAEKTRPQEVVYADSPQQLIKLYIQLERDFNQSIITLIDDDALIRNVRKYPDGRKKVLQLTGKQYKNLIAKTMFITKLRNDTNTYSQIAYKITGDKAVVTAIRYSHLKKYKSPVKWVLKQLLSGPWMISEEHSESRP